MIESGRQNKKTIHEPKPEARWRAEFDLYSRYKGSAQSFCNERGLVYTTFHYWRKKLSTSPKNRRLDDEISIPVLMPRTIVAAEELKLAVNGIAFSFQGSVSPEFIARVIVAMNERGQC